jgi:VanZ family protein
MTRIALVYAVLLFTVLGLADFGALGPVGRFVNAHAWLDKLIHFAMYGVLALLVNTALFTRPHWSWARSVVTGSIVALIASTVEEYTNLLVPCRSWSLGDLSANYLGILCIGILPLACLDTLSIQAEPLLNNPTTTDKDS